MNAPLVIGYSGTLAGYDPHWITPGPLRRFFNDWFWGYRTQVTDIKTRTGYYLFRGLVAWKRRWPDPETRLKVQLWGAINPVNERQVRELGLQSIVTVSGFIPQTESARKMMSCDVFFLPMETGINGRKPFFIPGKLFEYMASRKPILALAGASDCVDILNACGLGLVVSPFDEEAIADALDRLVANRGQLAELFVPNEEVILRYSSDRIVEQIANVINDCASVAEQAGKL
jgi:glycosyltransferase involved in cell wall biosynthesis